MIFPANFYLQYCIARSMACNKLFFSLFIYLFSPTEILMEFKVRQMYHHLYVDKRATAGFRHVPMFTGRYFLQISCHILQHTFAKFYTDAFSVEYQFSFCRYLAFSIVLVCDSVYFVSFSGWQRPVFPTFPWTFTFGGVQKISVIIILKSLVSTLTESLHAE